MYIIQIVKMLQYRMYYITYARSLSLAYNSSKLHVVCLRVCMCFCPNVHMHRLYRAFLHAHDIVHM